MIDQVALVVFPISKLIADIASTGSDDSSQHSRTECPFREDRAVMAKLAGPAVAEAMAPASAATRSGFFIVFRREVKSNMCFMMAAKVPELRG
jgi:hypothetical protein